MSPDLNLRENWRISLLVLLLVTSGVLLFVPSGEAEGPTNLQYGLELDGGTRLRAELVGMTAEGVGGVTADNVGDVEQGVAAELGLDQIDVTVRRTTQSTATVEVFDGNVTESEFVAALQAVGLDAAGEDLRSGVTGETRDVATDVLERRINQGGLTGGTVSTVTSGGGDVFVVAEVPGANRSEVLQLIGEPGRIQIVAAYPTEVGNETVTRRTPLLTQGDFAGIRPAQQASQGNPPRVPVTLTEPAAANFTNAMQNFGFTGPGVNACDQEAAYNGSEDVGYCLLTVVDGDVTYAADMSAGLAGDLRPGPDGEAAFLQTRGFSMNTRTFSEAQTLKLNLESGALPTELDIQSQLFLAPSLAQAFKPLALLTGLAAWLTVTGVIFYRYREPRVAIPMLGTAIAEVFILLGFAAGVGLALDLSHIAGFIAVIGTGVDDLVIIADEVLQRGEIKTGRVFQNRFRKAFWVIGAAAATTIIAMSPLAVLSLGDLQGFAIVTIVGVLIGVLITRPAYGNILRNLLLEE